MEEIILSEEQEKEFTNGKGEVEEIEEGEEDE